MSCNSGVPLPRNGRFMDDEYAYGIAPCGWVVRMPRQEYLQERGNPFVATIDEHMQATHPEQWKMIDLERTMHREAQRMAGQKKLRRLEWRDTPHPLGRHVEHDPRSREFPARRGARSTGVVEWKINAPTLDQAELGGCTGFSSATCMNSAPYYGERKKLNKGRYLTSDAAKQFYHEATVNDGFAGTWPPTDTGSTGLAVAKALKAHGWISSYSHCFGIDHVLDAIVVAPMIVGTVWLNDMFDLPSNKILSVSGDEAGGHEYCLHKADFRHEVLWFRQTWAGWRDFGIRFADFDGLLARDGDATVLAGSVA